MTTGNNKPVLTRSASLRVPPQSIDSEMAFLGSIMLRPEALHDIMDIVSIESFYAEKHRIIFQAMLDLLSKGNPIDLLSLSNRLKDLSKIDQAGGASYLAELVQVVPSSANIKFYAETVQKKYMMRKLIQCSDEICNMGFDEAGDLEVILDQAEKKIFEVTNFSMGHKFVEIKHALGEAYERYERLHHAKDGIRGVPTGFKELDNLLSGFQNSDLIILAARPSVGKTALALEIARKAAVNHGVTVAIFSLEMAAQQLVDRMLSAQSEVDAWKLRTGKNFHEDDFTRIRDSLDVLSRAPIFIDDQAGTNIIRMRSVARRLKSEHKLGLIVVDYLQLMAPTQSRNSDNVVQQITEISRSLKHLARELDVPVIALSQLSRAVEQRGGKPRLSDLRDSGSIEQDADVVMFIHREDKYKDQAERTNIAEILVEKHRNGPVGHVQLYFNDKTSSFRSIDNSNYGGADQDFSKM